MTKAERRSLSEGGWAAQPGSGPPRRIVIIRHAEKTGAKGDPHLSDVGYRHAAALARAIPARFGAVDAIIAAASHARSFRCVETVEVLAAQLGLEIDAHWDTDAVTDLAASVLKGSRYAGLQVLICWRHDRMKALAQALGVADAADWPPELYGEAWIIEPRDDVPLHIAAKSLRLDEARRLTKTTAASSGELADNRIVV